MSNKIESHWNADPYFDLWATDALNHMRTVEMPWETEALVMIAISLMHIRDKLGCMEQKMAETP